MYNLNLKKRKYNKNSSKNLEVNPDKEEHEDQLYDLNPKKRNYNKNSAKNLKILGIDCIDSQDISKSNTLVCQKYNKTFSRKDSLRRHINKFCK